MFSSALLELAAPCALRSCPVERPCSSVLALSHARACRLPCAGTLHLPSSQSPPPVTAGVDPRSPPGTSTACRHRGLPRRRRPRRRCATATRCATPARYVRCVLAVAMFAAAFRTRTRRLAVSPPPPLARNISQLHPSHVSFVMAMSHLWSLPMDTTAMSSTMTIDFFCFLNGHSSMT